MRLAEPLQNISSRKKCVSLWSGTRRISRPPRLVSVQPHLNSTGHCRTLSYSPSTTSLASCPPASIISFLIRSSYPRRSLSARSHSSRPATAQVPLLIAVSPASLCCLLCLPLPVFLRTCRECNTTPSPLVAALPAMVGRPATRTAERLPGLIAQSISSVCVQFVWIDCAPLTYLISHQRSGEAAMRHQEPLAALGIEFGLPFCSLIHCPLLIVHLSISFTPLSYLPSRRHVLFFCRT